MVSLEQQPGSGLAPARPEPGRDAETGKAPLGKRVLFHMLGDRAKASSRVRGYWIADELAARGHQIDYIVAGSKMDYLRLLRHGAASDAVIFQKRYSRYDVVIAKILRRLGVRVLFDLDDAPSRDRTPATERNAAALMRASHAVLVGSRNLEALARDAVGTQEAAKIALIASGVRLENYALSRPHTGPVCLGWIGNGAHYGADLVTILRPVLEGLENCRPFRLKIVGAAGNREIRDGFSGLDGVEVELIDQINWSDPGAVAQAISDFDIGLYPLVESAFNRYKCAFKALEYMASGLPVVASNVGANADVIRDKSTGFLVDDTDAWIARLRELIEDPARRQAMGLLGRTRVEAEYSTAALARHVETLL